MTTKLLTYKWLALERQNNWALFRYERLESNRYSIADSQKHFSEACKIYKQYEGKTNENIDRVLFTSVLRADKYPELLRLTGKVNKPEYTQEYQEIRN